MSDSEQGDIKRVLDKISGRSEGLFEVYISFFDSSKCPIYFFYFQGYTRNPLKTDQMGEYIVNFRFRASTEKNISISWNTILIDYELEKTNSPEIIELTKTLKSIIPYIDQFSAQFVTVYPEAGYSLGQLTEVVQETNDKFQSTRSDLVNGRLCCYAPSFIHCQEWLNSESDKMKKYLKKI